MSSTPPFLPSAITTPSGARLDALYNFTSQQQVTNPTGYSSNVRWWKDALREALRAGTIGTDRLVLDVGSSLVDELAQGSRRPKGIGSVLDGSLVPLTRFMSLQQPVKTPPTLARRAGRLAAAPLWWAVDQINPWAGAIESEDRLWKRALGSHVQLELVEQAGRLFVDHITLNPPLDYTSSLYSVAAFRREFGTICLPRLAGAKSPKQVASSAKRGGAANEGITDQMRLSKRDCEVLLKWLMRDLGAVVHDGEVLAPSQAANEHAITEADRGAVSVLTTLSRIEDQMTQLEEEGRKCQAKAKHHLALNQRPVALSYLRSKKQIDEVLAKRAAAASQLQAVIRALDQAKGDVEIMRAYEISTASLSAALAHPLLDADRVAATTDALADALADQREIEDAIRDGSALAVGAAGDAIDDDEIAQELEALVLEEKQRVEAEQKSSRTSKVDVGTATPAPSKADDEHGGAEKDTVAKDQGEAARLSATAPANERETGEARREAVAA